MTFREVFGESIDLIAFIAVTRLLVSWQAFKVWLRKAVAM